MKNDKLKELMARTKDLSINRVYPFHDSLNNLIDYIERVEKDNECLKNKLNSYSKEEEIAKLKEECNRLSLNSLCVLTDEEKKLANEFSKEHYEKCGRVGYIQYILTPTAIGTAIEVECAHCKERKNISDYGSW